MKLCKIRMLALESGGVVVVVVVRRRSDCCLGVSLDHVLVGGNDDDDASITLSLSTFASPSSSSSSFQPEPINIFSKSILSRFRNVILRTSSLRTLRGINIFEISLAVASNATLRLLLLLLAAFVLVVVVVVVVLSWVVVVIASSWNESRKDANNKFNVTRRCCPS